MMHGIIQTLYAYASALFFLPAALISITNPKDGENYNVGATHLSYFLYIIAGILMLISLTA